MLACPACGGSLVYEPLPDGRQGILSHEDGSCDQGYPVIDGIPRLLVNEARAKLLADRRAWFMGAPGRRALAERWTAPGARSNQIVEDFDYEWARFRGVGTQDLRAVFAQYFDIVPSELMTTDRIVLDAGCGAGRWALEVAARGPRVIAVDLGVSVEIARANAGANDRIACVQADLRTLPLRAEVLDWAYSLGVLHHLEQPERALRRIVNALRPGGAVLLYLYYALESRGRMYRGLFHLVDAMRKITSRAPRLVVLVVAFVFAALVYWPLARFSRLLARAGSDRWANLIPLAFYRDRSFAVMWNDSLDRFGTRLEHRYSREAMTMLFLDAGTRDIVFSDQPPLWHALGRRSAE